MAISGTKRIRQTGLTYNTTEPKAPATNAASEFMLSALVIGIERGWITRDQAYGRALEALRTYRKMEKFNGFTHESSPRSARSP